MTRLRLAGAVRWYGQHKDERCGDEPETCRCGFADLLERLDEIETSEDES